MTTDPTDSPAPGREVTGASFEARLPEPFSRFKHEEGMPLYSADQVRAYGDARAAEADAKLAALRVALIDLLALAKRANEIMLQEAGIGIVDLGAIERADAALATFDRETA